MSPTTENSAEHNRNNRDNYSKLDDERNNPCLKEHNIVYKCLNNNSYDYKKCELPVENYKMCKKFWGKVKFDRLKNGIRPILPELEDREKVKKEYKHLYM